MRVLSIDLACIAVLTHEVKVVVALKQTMVLNNPVVLFADVRRKQRGCNLRVICRRQDVANVMQ